MILDFNLIKTNRSWLAAALAAFIMPFYLIWSAVSIGIFVFVLLSDANAREKLWKFSKNKMLYPMILLFIMYGIGLLYSSNAVEGWSDLQSKFSLLLLPVFLSCLDYSKKEKVDFVMSSFIAGCLLAGLICLVNALFTWFKSGVNNFFYVDFSIFMHPSYSALYLNLALCYIYQKAIFENSIKYIRMPIAIVILFFINVLILLLSSKAGIFTATFVQVAMLTVSILRRMNSRKAIGIFVGLTAFCFLFYKVVVPEDKERIHANSVAMTGQIPDTSFESSGVRLLIWKSCLPLVQKSFLTGVGTGGVKEELMKSYKSDGIRTALMYGLNAHNQFLETLLEIGLAGLTFLLLSLALPFIKGVKTSNFLLYIFPCIAGFNFLFESMLERQAGIVFFTFFSTLLIMFASEGTLNAKRPVMPQ